KARGIHGDDILEVVKHTEQDEQTGETLEWGFVGRVTDVDVAPVEAFLHSHITPIVTPLGRDAERRIYNVNADDAAAALAQALKARKLVFLSDVPGVLGNPQDPESLFSTIKVKDVEGLIKRGVIDGGMLPKIGGAIKAIEAGVQKTHIIDASMPHSLLLELFTDRGVGTEIVQ
ncbi:MAG: acetylglutamate kinase, partial [Kiritimatiellae bacterium]|nr:acetylglutamate kinase [Kiritimatiellia bacterium]